MGQDDICDEPCYFLGMFHHLESVAYVDTRIIHLSSLDAFFVINKVPLP